MSGADHVIIKKVKKVSGEGHHGGAWKVAYADFVTAMMAFFLLMWLLNATTEDQRKGIADYFNPTIPVSTVSGGGSSVLDGSTVFSEDTLAKNGTGGARASQGEALEDPETPGDNARDEAGGDNETLKSLEEALLNQVAGEASEGLARHIMTKVTPEGLVIELTDVDGSPLFNVGSTDVSPTMRLLLKVVTNSLTLVTNEISIVGHTDGLAYSGARNYSNWELSTDRAHMARRLMVEAGLPTSQINEVAGKADTEPLVQDRYAPQNRRISITILKS